MTINFDQIIHHFTSYMSITLLLNFLTWLKSRAGTQAPWLLSNHNLLPLSS